MSTERGERGVLAGRAAALAAGVAAAPPEGRIALYQQLDVLAAAMAGLPREYRDESGSGIWDERYPGGDPRGVTAPRFTLPADAAAALTADIAAPPHPALRLCALRLLGSLGAAGLLELTGAPATRDLCRRRRPPPI